MELTAYVSSIRKEAARFDILAKLKCGRQPGCFGKLRDPSSVFYDRRIREHYDATNILRFQPGKCLRELTGSTRFDGYNLQAQLADSILRLLQLHDSIRIKGIVHD